MKWPKYVLPICLAISLLSFIPAYRAGFFFDFVGWQNAYAKGTFGDIWTCFGYPGNHQFLHFVFYNFYQLFHLQPLPWYILFCSLHAINGFLLFKCIMAFSQVWKIQIQPLFALAAAILFLLNPYNVEAVVAKVCVHYLMSLGISLLLVLLFFRFIHGGERKYALIGGLLFTLSLFSLEISFVSPAMISMVGLITGIVTPKSDFKFRRILEFAGLLWVLLGCYLILNMITLGSVVGHYGSDTHLKLDILAMTATELKYFIKHLFYARFYSFHTKVTLFDEVLSLPEVAFAFICLVLAFTIVYFILIKKLKSYWHLAYFGFWASLLYILPVSNLYFTHLHIGHNDRYDYISLAFFYMFLIAIISRLKGYAGYAIVVLLLMINIFFQQKTLSYWKVSTEVLQSLIKDFRWHDAPYVFILNAPDNYKGILMACIYEEPTGIDELIDNQTLRPYDGVMHDVFQYNMTTPDDGVKVEQTGPLQLKVTFNQWGNWWHNSGIGASSYENEYYKAEILEYPYLLTFKKFPPGSVIIYQVGDKWEEFKLN